MGWKLLEFATAEVNRSFHYNTLNVFMVGVSSGCKLEVAKIFCLWASGTVIHCHYIVSVLLFYHFANDISPFSEHLTGHPCEYIIFQRTGKLFTLTFLKGTG